MIIQRVNETTFAGPGVGSETLTVVRKAWPPVNRSRSSGGYADLRRRRGMCYRWCRGSGPERIDQDGEWRDLLQWRSEDHRFGRGSSQGRSSIGANLNTNESDVVAAAEKYFGSAQELSTGPRYR